MIYCFVLQDLSLISETNIFKLQEQYAVQLGKACYCDLKNKKILDINNNMIDVRNMRICLRASISFMDEAIELLSCSGAVLLENFDDIERIYNWVELKIHNRKIYKLRYKDLLERNIEIDIINREDKIFLKSLKKGFSLICSQEQFINCDKKLINILQNFLKWDDEILVSQYFDIEKDSLGKKEARFFVMNGEIISQSRYFLDLKHVVYSKLNRKAMDLVCKISKMNFPSNYVMDLGIFQNGSKSYIDVIEINPFTSSLCYVNNTIFKEIIPDVKKIVQTTGFGAEYALDYLENDSRYNLVRKSNASYVLINENRFDLIKT